MSLEWTEWLGYAASVIVAASLTMNNIRRLRWINMAGALAFTVYGALLNLYPVLIVNAFIVGINIYYITRMRLTRDRFNLISIDPKSSVFLPRFIDFHKSEISEHFPDFDADSLDDKEVIFITRNVIPVGLIVYSEKPNAVIEIVLDYAIPTYRDYENATYFFQEFSTLMHEKGFKKYISYCKVPVHQRYLRRMKFKEDPHEPEMFVRNI